MIDLIRVRLNSEVKYGTGMMTDPDTSDSTLGLLTTIKFKPLEFHNQIPYTRTGVILNNIFR